VVHSGHQQHLKSHPKKHRSSLHIPSIQICFTYALMRLHQHRALV
jgi:hypothetical protein